MAHVTDLSVSNIGIIGWCWWPHGHSWYNFPIGDHDRSRFTAQAWWCCEFWRELWSRTCTRNQAGLGIQHWTTAGTAWKDLKHVQWCERMWHISVWNHWLCAFREETGLEICSPQLLDASALHLDSLLLQLQRAAPIFVTNRRCYCFIASGFFTNFANLPAPEFDAGPNTYQILSDISLHDIWMFFDPRSHRNPRVGATGCR